MTSIKFRALTHNDHKLFFEALGEHGKDFQNIQQYMAQKCGKNSNKSADQNKALDPQEKREQEKKEEDKKREQIRNFYNKLYTKLSQLVGKLDDRVEKINQELYLLINYGEIWKKHGFKFNNKTKKLLEELVHQGYTTLRFKNKNVRLRTPPCKALKKINEIGVDEKVKVVSSRELPKDVVVEFHPATNCDWLKVQSMSQNPRVRAKLSIQKRISNILEFLENKWNLSQDKLNRTVDVWLKVPPVNQSHEDIHQQQQLCPPNNTFNNGSESANIATTNSSTTNLDQAIPSSEIRLRLRLKPSAQHELKEVNITRVVPDNHLDLSLSAYIKRIGESMTKNSEQQLTSGKSGTRDTPSSHDISHNLSDEPVVVAENLDISQGGMSTSSRLPISLTTPDSSILLERSCTSDQPSIAQARKHLNYLQTLAGSFEGYENSRTACEDTQERPLLGTSHNDAQRASNFGGRSVSFSEIEPKKRITPTRVDASATIPALFDECATIETDLPSTLIQESVAGQTGPITSCQLNSDSQNSKSVDFHIPKNLTLGDWLTLKDGQNHGADDANDAFPTYQPEKTNQVNDADNVLDQSKCILPLEEPDSRKTKIDLVNSNPVQPHNHMIEMKKLAEGWTRQEESSMTIGELYLAFKCPEKIVLEYEFEQELSADKQIAPASNKTLIFKLLTAASLSLAHIEHQKQEQQHKPVAKLKRRKGPNTIKYLTLHDIEATNQRVEEALKQLQPTRLTVYRRAR